MGKKIKNILVGVPTLVATFIATSFLCDSDEVYAKNSYSSIMNNSLSLVASTTRDSATLEPSDSLLSKDDIEDLLDLIDSDNIKSSLTSGDYSKLKKYLEEYMSNTKEEQLFTNRLILELLNFNEGLNQDAIKKLMSILTKYDKSYKELQKLEKMDDSDIADLDEDDKKEYFRDIEKYESDLIKYTKEVATFLNDDSIDQDMVEDLMPLSRVYNDDDSDEEDKLDIQDKVNDELGYDEKDYSDLKDILNDYNNLVIDIDNILSDDDFEDSLDESTYKEITKLLKAYGSKNFEERLKLNLKLIETLDLPETHKEDTTLEILEEYMDLVTAKKGNGVEVKGYKDENGVFQTSVEREINPNKADVTFNKSTNTLNVYLYAVNREVIKISKDPIEIEVTAKKTIITLRGEKFEVEEEFPLFVEGTDNLKVVRKDSNGNYVTVPHRVEKNKIFIKTRIPQGLIFTKQDVVDFNDVKDKTGEKEALKMQELLIVKSDSNGKYNSNTPITRADFSTMIANALELHPTTNKYQFKDIIGKPYADDVQALYEAGIISGYENGNFGGQDNLTRQQAMAIIAKMLDYTGVDTATDHKMKVLDYNSISDYAKPGVNFLAKNRIIREGNNINFNPSDKLTRGHMAQILMRSLELSDWY